MDFLTKVLLMVFSLESQARIISVPRQAKLTLAANPSYYLTNIDGHPGTYAFGYDVHDPHTGNIQFRSEERYPNGTVVGSYGYVDANGRPQRYKYIADARGYRVMNDIITEPSIKDPMEVNNKLESSVTWTRPRRPIQKRIATTYVTKIPRNKVTYQNNLLLPPSYYASHD